MLSFIRRCCSFPQDHFVRSAAHPHIYLNFPYKNDQELTQHLAQNVIMRENGLALLNKPPGLKKESAESIFLRKDYITMHPVFEEINHLSFSGVLPSLSKALSMENLELVKLPERFISGVAILATDDKTRKLIKVSLGDFSTPYFTYLAVCVGIPIKSSDRRKLGLIIRQENNYKKAVLLDQYSKNSVERREVFPATFHHDTLATNELLNVSLVRIKNNRNKWHALRAYCGLKLLAPILGDIFYGSCVRTVRGKMLPVNPLSPIANLPTKLPGHLLSTLEMRGKDKMIIPAHLHLAGVTLRKFSERKVYVAKLPDYFLWTCQKLQLHVPEIYLQNSVVDQTDFDSIGVKKN